MIIAFYSDHPSAAHAAVLTADTLARVDQSVLLVQVPADGSRAGDTIRTGSLPAVKVAHVAMGPRAAHDLGTVLDDAVAAGRDVVLALPFELLGASALSARADLRVLPCGRDFMATDESRRAARRPGDAGAAPWILACDGDTGVPGRSPLGLVLPVKMPCLCGQDSRAMMVGITSARLQRRAVLMTAAMVAASVDPRRPLDRVAFAKLLGDAETAPREPQALLRSLAEAYDRLAPDAVEVRARPVTSPARRPVARGPVATRRHARAPGAALGPQAVCGSLARALRV
ncbi:hypothetical protein [Salinarimonas soli]|uniref:Uncharacterized protein n=1 Tax=Salinarimonas soli TaxID=1638099 RepID=A0A5B2VBS5_9HYPH|nr:hypothetical protein [Salinarimonas soli]KAA2235872.1 hypothetical protein F0L46_17680 [Salinarimonas soli]